MKRLLFSNLEWNVKSAWEDKVGPGPNYFSDLEQNVFVDDAGLHLSVGTSDGKAYSTEVSLDDSLGFGEYKFKVLGQLDNIFGSTVFGAFLYQDDENEIDIEFGHALAGHGKGQYVIQPGAENVERFQIPSESETTHSIFWTKDSVRFKTWAGHEDEPSGENLIHEWVYYGSCIDNPLEAKMIFNLWLYKGQEPEGRHEIIVKSFSFHLLQNEI